MSGAFFVSWQLWEQMTFILATTILLVFCLGWVKLWWTSRKNRKQVTMDEEKRVKIQELRKSGSIIKLDQDKDEVPFGIRALQSGIEIDGIWVSASTTPIPESPKQLRDSDQSSDSSFESIDDGRPLSLRELTPPRISFSGQSQTVFRPSRPSVEPKKTIESSESSNFKISVRDIASIHKPRRSSRLRFSSLGENQVNQDTLSQLESTTPMVPQKTCHDHGSHAHADIVESSSETAADNECSSGSDSDSSLTNPLVTAMSKQVLGISYSRVTSNMSGGGGGDHGIYAFGDSRLNSSLSKKGNHSSVLQESSPTRKVNPFTTPEVSPKSGLMETGNENRSPTIEIKKAIRETRWPLLEPSMEPVFSPGTFHFNQTARKINPGFELLPAGTFNPTTVSVRNIGDGNRASTDLAEGHQKRSPKKLQKRVRDSVTMKRTSIMFGKF